MMTRTARWLATFSTFLAFAPAVSAEDGPTAAASLTLGQWLEQDRAAGRLPEGAARDAALRTLHDTVLDGLRAARKAEDEKTAAGALPAACFPSPGAAQVTSAEVSTWLHARPAAEHQETMRQALARFAAERFPCR